MPIKNKKPTIITIDDEEMIRKSFRHYLEDYNFDIIEADNGKTGLEIIYKTNPDLVLLDLRMPEMDGLEVLTELSKNSPNTPVIVISGAGVMEDVVKALKLGAWDYLFKPIQDISMLLHAVNSTLEKAQLKTQNIEYQNKLEKAYKQVQNDLQAGKDIQLKLLPENNKTIGNYIFSHKILPSMYLSGDFADYFEVDENHIAFYSADVSGHGVPSALITVLLKSFIQKNYDAFKSKNHNNILKPEILITALNSELLRENLDKHIAIFYGVINNSDNTLTYCNAGQFPHPLILSNNTSKYLQNKGTPVGMLSFIKYKQHTIELPLDFTFIILSDGILEVLTQKKLKDQLEYIQSLKTQTQFETLINSISDTNKQFPDDITYLSIKRIIK